MIDPSKECINVNFWGDLSELNVKEGDIVVINGARVVNFGGKSLNVGSEHAKVFINPTNEELQC
jgi:hypothetical protein